MKLPRLTSASCFIPVALFVCVICLLGGCKDSQDIVPLISQDSGPSLSAKEVAEATELMEEFTMKVQIDDEEEKEVELELYQGGEMEDGKAYIILPKMRQRAVEENPEWRQIDAMAAPDLETLKARARADSQSVKKKRSEDPGLAQWDCYIWSPYCNAAAAMASISSHGNSDSSSHLHGYHFYTRSGYVMDAWGSWHGGNVCSHMPGPPSWFVEMVGQVTDIWGACHIGFASYCSSGC